MSTYDDDCRDTWLEIDLDQLRRNIDTIGAISSVPLLVVVKANAYGHGLVPVAQVAQECGVKMLGVATAGEAQILRDNGIEIGLLRITAFGLSEIESLIQGDVQFFVWEVDQIRAVQMAAESLGKVANVHVKIDTGMGRIGVFPAEAFPIAQNIAAQTHVRLAGVGSHFCAADAEDLSSTQAQLTQFSEMMLDLRNEGIDPGVVHFANSPALLRLPKARFDMVRTGVITYGVPYEDGVPLPEQLRPIAQWKTKVVALRTLPRGHGVSYGSEYVTSQEERIAVIPVGYADGFRRYPSNSNEVLLGGRRVRTVGRICMDQAMLRIPDDMEVQLGQTAVIMGSQEGDTISSLDMAARWGTNNYDVLCNISPRVPRRYLGASQ
jgi:alanine racemase